MTINMSNILIVDDDYKLCEVLAEELEELGFQTNATHSVSETIKFLQKNKNIDLILLDLKLPDKDGLSFLKMLKENNLDYKVIILTAFADIQSAIESERLGVCDFISKPYDFDELVNSINKALQKDYET
ncbi:response regulator [Melioribacteraceae bacterium 4301-Me]|uniref:response regulator n=1 Tax=Pyranulibacter aquaticus TaxID=3163344 RepID=UPI0035953602